MKTKQLRRMNRFSKKLSAHDKKLPKKSLKKKTTQNKIGKTTLTNPVGSVSRSSAKAELIKRKRKKK